MCYDIKATKESQLKRAIRRNDSNAVKEIREELIPLTDLPLFHVSGFSHPRLLIYTMDSPDRPEVAFWGLIPHWVNRRDQIVSIWNKTINARGETMFEKPSFKQSANNGRCILCIDGFYEHHHYKRKTYPFFIQSKDATALSIAGLSSDWVNQETGEIIKTFSIVTVKGNNLMSQIHNNPKLKEPRMPLILNEKQEDLWLQPYNKDKDIAALIDLVNKSNNHALIAYTVNRLRGKNYHGNIASISNEVKYKELNFSPNHS